MLSCIQVRRSRSSTTLSTKVHLSNGSCGSYYHILQEEEWLDDHFDGTTQHTECRVDVLLKSNCWGHTNIHFTLGSGYLHGLNMQNCSPAASLPPYAGTKGTTTEVASHDAPSNVVLARVSRPVKRKHRGGHLI